MLTLARTALLAAGAALAALAATPASAQDGDFAPKNYVFLGGGIGFDGDLDAEDVTAPGDFFDNFDEINDLDDDDGADLSPGWQVFGGLGASNAILPGLRLELEGLFGNNDLDDFDALELRTLGGFGNALYQFKIWRIEPYVGGGVGYGRSKLQFDPDDELGFDDDDIEISDGGLIWQIKAGLAFPLGRRTTLDIGYRYLNGANIDNAEIADPFSGIVSSADLDPEIHAVNAGIRYSFGGGQRGGWGF